MITPSSPPAAGSPPREIAHGAFFQEPPETLSPPRIPIAEHNGGLRKKDLDDNAVPVQALISGYQQIQVNDLVELFWDGQLASQVLIESKHIEQGSITANIPIGVITEGLGQVHYQVTSPNGQNSYRSLPLEVLVKLTVPGNPDPVPSTPENENLLEVSGVPGLIDEANVGAITASIRPYPYMSEGDRIKLSWGGEFILYTVQAADIDRAIGLNIPRATIEQAGSGEVVLEYEIRDVVNNWSLWSRKFTCDVEIGDDLLLAPDALQLSADGKLDLAVLGNDDVAVRVRVYPGMAVGDELTLTWEARLPAGDTVRREQKTTVDEFGLPVMFQVANATAKDSAQGTVALKYTVERNGGRQQFSRRTTFEVIGQPQSLAPPGFKEAPADELDVGDIPVSGATVIVAQYPNQAIGDWIELFIYGVDDGGAASSHYERTLVEHVQPTEFTVPKAFFNPLVAGRLEAFYRVNDERSGVRKLKVVGEASGTLLAPKVVGAVGGELDPDEVTAGTEVEILQYQGKASGDRVTLHWAGLDGASLSETKQVDDGNLIRPIAFDIAYAPYIIDNLDNTVQVSYGVVRAGGGSASSVVVPILVQRKAGEVFPEPRVPQAQQPEGTTLFPYNARNGATVEVRYANMSVADSIIVSFIGDSDAATFVSDPRPGHAGGQVDFTVPAAVVGASQNSTVKLHYSVVRGGQAPVSSRALDLRVTSLGAGRLPQAQIPQINQATDELDLRRFQGNAEITLASWPLIGERQLYWIEVTGVLESGQQHSFYLADAQPVSQTEVRDGVRVSLPRAQLERLQDRSPLTVIVHVAFDRNRDRQRARLFPTRQTRLIRDNEGGQPLPRPVIAHANGDVLDPADAPDGTTVTVSRDVLIAGDRLETRWLGPLGQEGVDSHINTRNITHTEADKDQQIIIAAALITANLNQTVEVGYRIFNRGLESQRIDLQVRGAAPGYPAPTVAQAPTGTLNPMDARNGAVVNLAYPGMQTGDVIQVSWQGAPGAGTPPLAPVNGSAGGSVAVDVPASAVGANIGKGVTVSYSVTRGGRTDSSPPLALTVSGIPAVHLATPELDHDKNGVLDLNGFVGDTTLHVQPWPFIATGQRYWLEGRGTLKGGGDYQHSFRINVTVTADDVSAGLALRVQRSELEKLALDAPFQLTFSVNFQGVNSLPDAQRFPVRQVQVIDGAGGALLAPTVEGAVGDRLDPISARQGATVNVAYPGMRASDVIQVRWEGVAGDGTPPLEPVSGAANGAIKVQIPASAVGANIGKGVTVSYTVTRGGPAEPSPPLNLRVGFISSSDLRMPALDHDVNGVLNLNSFAGDTTLRVEPWPFIAAGQRYWLEGRGRLQAGGSYEHDFRINVTVRPAEVTTGLALTVQRSELEKLRLDEAFRLALKVNFEQVNDRGAAQGFPVRQVTVARSPVGLPVPQVEKATGPGKDQLDMKDFYRAEHVVVTVKQYAGMKAGDTVRVEWNNPRFRYRTPIHTVKAAGDLAFRVPRMELIDSIGQTVPVSYSVVRGVGQPVEQSEVLTLRVARQPILLPPPRYNTANREVSLLYSEQEDGHTAQVRWDGALLRQTGTLWLRKGVVARHVIDQLWVSENSGKTVLVNYSISRQRPDENLLFSQVLRVSL